MPRETPPTNTKASLSRDEVVLCRWNRLQRLFRCHSGITCNSYRAIGERLGMKESSTFDCEQRALDKIKTNGAAMVVLKKCMTQKTRE